jgi:hypothetical protein
MKRTLLFVAAALFALTSCTKEIKTETLRLEEDIPLHEGSENHLDLNLDIDFPVSGFSKEALEEVRKAIRVHTLGENYTEFTGSLAELGKAWRDALAEDYIDSNTAMLEEMEMAEEDAPFLNWGYDYKGTFGESYDKYINYFVEQYQYLGGAHGMYGTFPFVFRLSDGQEVDWTVVAPGVSEEKMCALLLKHRMDDMKDIVDEEEGINEEDIFFSETIEPSPWFSVDKEGLTFYYQPYDLAPYVFGVITVPVPWSELK